MLKRRKTDVLPTTKFGLIIVLFRDHFWKLLLLITVLGIIGRESGAFSFLLKFLGV